MIAFSVSAPASSANLGAGFDAVALALELRMTARVHGLAHDGVPVWTYSGRHAPTHDGLRGTVERGIARVAPNAPPLAVEFDNAIPLGAGLGSSAAAYAIGVAIGARLVETMPDDDHLVRAVAQLEGHPDNALAAWYGGAVVGSLDGERLTSLRFSPPDLHAVVVVPELSLPTGEARAMLPDRYARADAVFNVQHAALLGAALASGRTDALGEAMRDRLHQPYRAAAIAGLAEILAVTDPALSGIALSGAGPSVLALARNDPERVGALIAAIFARHEVPSATLTLRPASTGILVRSGT
ncbi:MAG TPA: homoserine kinase [Candidatus Elarobacter sp.]|nr:homoserine kinase [Candidatus Elarobacter sp.]